MSAIRSATEGRVAWPALALCLTLAAGYAALGAVLARQVVNSARTHATLALS